MKITLVRFILICCSFFGLAYACGTRQTNSHWLEEAARWVNTNPDTSFLILSRITEPEQLSGAEKADYGYLLSLTHYKQGKAMTEDSLILYSLDYYEQQATTDKLPIAYLLAANYYDWQEETEAARAAASEGIRHAGLQQDSLLLALLYRKLAGLSDDHRQSITYIQEAIRYNPAAKTTYFYNIAINYSRLGEGDSANYYFHQSIDATDSLSAYTLNFRRRNYADHLEDEGKYREALALLHQSMEESGDTAHLSIAWNYLSLHRLDSAQFYLDKLTQSHPELYISAANAAMTAQTLIDYSNNKPISWGRIGRYNDSIYLKGINDLKLLEEKITVKNQLQERNLRLTIQRQRTQLYITRGIVFLAMAALILIFYISAKRKRLAEAEERREVLERMLKEATESNTGKGDFAKKMILQQLGFIRLVANAPTSHNQQLLKQVSAIDNPNDPIDRLLVWDDFYGVIDTVYDGFYSHISSKFSEKLSEKEIQLCCLLRAAFSTKEISVLTGQQFQTIYQRKTTIRQKLGMDEKEDIVDFLSA